MNFLRSVSCRFINSNLVRPAFSTEVSQTPDKKTGDDIPSTPLQNQELAELLAINKNLLEGKKDFEDKYKRALAEAENVRRRMRRQVDEAKLFGIQSFCKDLLEVADILNKATQSCPEDQLKSGVNPHFVQLFEGLEMTNLQLEKVFGKHSLVKIDPEIGEKFDPNLHEAMFTVPATGDTKANTIAIVQKVGYRLQERTLRAACVGVFA